jgi:hypothetical protein
VTTSVVVDAPDFVAVHIGFTRPQGPRQFWRYLIERANGQIETVRWAELNRTQKAAVLAMWQQKTPAWAQGPDGTKKGGQPVNTNIVPAAPKGTSMVMPAGRQPISAALLEQLVDAELKTLGSSKATFTAWNVTLNLRTTQPQYNIVHDDVRDLVHAKMDLAVMAGLYQTGTFHSPKGPAIEYRPAQAVAAPAQAASPFAQGGAPGWRVN